MSEWSKSEYEGPIENGWFQGKGKYRYPNGVIYDGEFDKGEFHGDGTLVYQNGGRYVAKWERGKLISGKYYFFDDLEYNFDSWNYCINQDRRFYTEITKSLRPDGKTLMTNDINGPPEIPPGTYDVGDGYYDPDNDLLFNYDGTANDRELEKTEREWAITKCRYVPKDLNPAELTGKNDKVIQKVIEVNKGIDQK